MTLIEILYSIIIKPLQLIFDIIFSIANRTTGSPGLSIVALSLIVNFLALPLYMRADKMQEEQRSKEAMISDGVKHIKSVFKGDERMMILQTYYRQTGYRQTDVLKSSVSLFLQIPFFIAAYRFLSDLELLEGVSLGPIRNLSQPDALLMIGGLTINILPFIMTGINFVSGSLFSKGFPLKTKIQLYALSVFFLLFLYNSPSGLVFYWTLNNTFSLVKNIFYKLKDPKKALTVLSGISAVVTIVIGVFVYNTESTRKRILIIAIGLLLLLPLIISFLRKHKIHFPVLSGHNTEKHGILAEGIFLSVLLGLTIPSAVIASSPLEFADIDAKFNPIIYIISSSAIAVGFFVLWLSIFYWITNNNAKHIFEMIVWILCGTAIINYMFFGSNPGVLTSALKYILTHGLPYTTKDSLLNLGILLIAGFILFFIRARLPLISKYACYTGIIVLVIMSSLNINKINNYYRKACENLISAYDEKPNFTLSKKGKNVIVLMLDRSLNEFIPYIFDERPELNEKFAGFTYYPNTVSFGAFTNFGSPSVFGGYEYTPIELNKRNTEKLKDKQNEALKVMPVIFGNNGYDVTVCDPTYAGYQWIPDLSVFDDHPEFHKYITTGKFTDPEVKKLIVKDNKRNFFCYSLMKTSPILIRKTIYNNGDYNNSSPTSVSTQVVTGTSIARGISDSFLNCYSVLTNLSEMTHIEDSGKDTFMMMSNSTTHEPSLLQEPNYIPEVFIDNTKYDNEHMDRFTHNGISLVMENETQFIHYETNMAALLRLCEWFDYLRENGVYDNTRIILVADHGRDLYSLQDMQFSDTGTGMTCDLEFFYPLLMVKDFGSTEFTVSEEFMTNADVPTLASQELINNPVNPFTGEKIDNSEKTAHDQYILYSTIFDVEINNGNTFLPADWLSVHDDMRKKENWKLIARDKVLSEYN